MRVEKRLVGALRLFSHIKSRSAMREPRAGRHRPVHSLNAVAYPISEMLPRDFDGIREAEVEALRQVASGHSFDATLQGVIPAK